MPNGNELSAELKFDEQIKDFTKEGQFLARQLYETCEKLENHDGRITDLEHRDRKILGISGLMSSVIAGIISYFTK